MVLNLQVLDGRLIYHYIINFKCSLMSMYISIVRERLMLENFYRELLMEEVSLLGLTEA